MNFIPVRGVGNKFQSPLRHRGGVQVHLAKAFSKGVYVHCNSHRLNLVLCTAAKVSGDVANNTQQHPQFIMLQKEMHPNRQCMELDRPCEMRWSSKSGSMHKIFVLPDVYLEALAKYVESSGQTRIV